MEDRGRGPAAPGKAAVRRAGEDAQLTGRARERRRAFGRECPAGCRANAGWHTSVRRPALPCQRRRAAVRQRTELTRFSLMWVTHLRTRRPDHLTIRTRCT